MRSQWLFKEEDVRSDKSSGMWGPKSSCPPRFERKPQWFWRKLGPEFHINGFAEDSAKQKLRW